MKVDLNALCESLRDEQSMVNLRRFLATQSIMAASFPTASKRARPWRELQIISDVAQNLHPTTIQRLEADEYNEQPLLAECMFRRLSTSGASIEKALPTLRPLVTPYNGDFRKGAVVAEAGYTGLVSVFPAANSILPTLAHLETFRNSATLGHPVWNALFLETMLLSLHPFHDGNGRTIRAFTDYELWRNGIGDPSIKNIRRHLDANRATQLELLTNLHAAESVSCTDAIRAYLIFLIKLRTGASRA